MFLSIHAARLRRPSAGSVRPCDVGLGAISADDDPGKRVRTRCYVNEYHVAAVIVIRAARPRPRLLIRVSQLCSGIPCPRPERALAGVGGAQGGDKGGVVGDGRVRGGASTPSMADRGSPSAGP